MQGQQENGSKKHEQEEDGSSNTRQGNLHGVVYVPHWRHQRMRSTKWRPGSSGIGAEQIQTAVARGKDNESSFATEGDSDKKLGG